MVTFADVLRVMERLAFLAFFAAFSGALAASSAAVAQDSDAPSASEVALAREQFRLGIDASREERWLDALDAFSRSYGLAPRPITLLNLAGAQVQVGRLVEASESYRRFLREAREGRAAEQRPAAQEALASVEARVARLRIEIRGLANSDRVALDAHAISSSALGAELPVDPGARVIRVEREGRQVLREEVTLAEGEHRAVTYTVRAPPPRIGRGTGDDPRDGRDGNGHRDEDDGGGVFSSPAFWIIAGVIAAGTAATLLILFAGPTEPAYIGNVPPGSIALQ